MCANMYLCEYGDSLTMGMALKQFLSNQTLEVLNLQLIVNLTLEM